MVFTDHKPLCSLLTSDHLNGRLKRFSTKLQPWLIEFKYLPGIENTLADALCRQDWQRREEIQERNQTTELQQNEEEKTGATVVLQSGVGGCGGPAPQE